MKEGDDHKAVSNSSIIKRGMHALKWRLGLRHAKASTSTILLDSKTARSGTHFSIKPNKQRDIVIRSLPPGEYTLSLVHTDQLLKDFRKKIFVTFHPSTIDTLEDLAKELKLPISAGGKVFGYLGGGKTRKGRTSQFLNFRIETPRPWIKISLHSALDRYINIDKLGVSLQEAKSRLSPNTANWIDIFKKRPELADAEFILYADIDMNIVDGSSVWLSSMASSLAQNGKTILLTKRNVTNDVIWSNILHQHNIIQLSPKDIGLGAATLDMNTAITVIREIDHHAPNIRRVVVRGLRTAKELCADRQFHGRSCIYLTDFYAITDGQFTISDEQAQTASIIALQAGRMLMQTQAIEDKLLEISQTRFPTTSFPPPIPDTLPSITPRAPITPPIKIGYAGKITPDWGLDELLDWTEGLRAKGHEIELHIVANRISDGAGTKRVHGFANSIRQKMETLGAHHYSDFNREKAMSMMADMDIVWCYRPGRLEENTLELSTKLVEMVGAGAICVCYPSSTNKNKLGADYPFFLTSQDDLEILLKADIPRVPVTLAERIKQDHSLKNIATKLGDEALGQPAKGEKTILFSGHDFKFADAYISHLKSEGHTILRDIWSWGQPVSIESSKHLLKKADIIFCEWGLANAVWHSHNKLESQKLFVRIHLQEINERARKFGHQITSESVDKFIFVSDSVRKTAIEMFGWPEGKTTVIPNFVLDNEYQPTLKNKAETIHIGMVGIIPQRKRFDRAVELLAQLLDSGKDAHLHIKGPRPEELEFMRAPGRAPELVYYNEVYERIKADPELESRITFYPWGNDVALWYRKIDFILSPSDFESFHYALADGILSGCEPIIWPWDEAADLYSQDWLIDDTHNATTHILEHLKRTPSQQSAIAAKKRELIIKRYGKDYIFDRLSETLSLETPETESPV